MQYIQWWRYRSSHFCHFLPYFRKDTCNSGVFVFLVSQSIGLQQFIFCFQRPFKHQSFSILRLRRCFIISAPSSHKFYWAVLNAAKLAVFIRYKLEHGIIFFRNMGRSFVKARIHYSEYGIKYTVLFFCHQSHINVYQQTYLSVEGSIVILSETL